MSLWLQYRDITGKLIEAKFKNGKVLDPTLPEDVACYTAMTIEEAMKLAKTSLKTSSSVEERKWTLRIVDDK